MAVAWTITSSGSPTLMSVSRAGESTCTSNLVEPPLPPSPPPPLTMLKSKKTTIPPTSAASATNT
ncbi:MAG: hypothetical protein M5U18_00965 [Dehalococcoidia bacterium]|nr:hypothetical protein [Dehalococcoidia bacterium]